MLDKVKSKKVSASILAITILVLILVCLFVLFFEINDYRKIKSEVHDLYYYFISNKVDFQANIVLDSKNIIMSLESPNVTLTSAPLYYKDYDKMLILPQNMEIVYPYKNNPMYKVGEFSKIYYKGNYLYINSQAGLGRLYDCFFYDGENLYTFIENTTIKVNDVLYELSPLSFVDVSKEFVRIYNYAKDEHTLIKNYSGSVEAYTDEYTINLLNDTFMYGTSYYMLIKNIDGLKFVEF